MGKKRVAYDLNDDHKPPNDVVIDHHHHHHHRHHNHQKPKKIKPEAKLLHTLNSHLKKLAKSRSRNMISLSSPPSPAKVNNTHHHDHLSNSWLKHDHKEDGNYDWFMGFDSDLDDGCMGVFEFSQELCWDTTSTSVIGSKENYEDLFGGNCVFSPDLIVSHNMVWVFEGDDGFGYRSYIPDPVMNTDFGDEGKFLCDMLELSSQEDMINEFLKVNLFVS